MVPVPMWCTHCRPIVVRELREHADAASPALAVDLRAMADEIEGDQAASFDQQVTLNELRTRIVRESRTAVVEPETPAPTTEGT